MTTKRTAIEMNPIWTIKGGVFDPALTQRQAATLQHQAADGCGRAAQVAAQIAAQQTESGVAPFCIWGIVNVTPDSFYDGGAHPSPQTALAHARLLAREGAGVLDIGGASSRPGSADVSAAEEVARVLPIVDALIQERAGAPDVVLPDTTQAPMGQPKPALGQPQPIGSGVPLISVDTWRAEVAEATLRAGADIINDISACAWEPALRDVIARYKPGYVLMHCQGRPGDMQAAPRYDDIVSEVLSFFEREMKALTAAGLPESNIMLDPGIGFGKTVRHNADLLAGMERLLQLGRPVLLGISQKSFFGDLLGLARQDRGEATLVCTALMAARGVMHHRVHDVAGAGRALSLVRAVAAV